jgi:predicted RNA-binding Zn ribbon-like protein
MSHIGDTAPAEITVRTRRSVADVLWLANTRHGPGGHWFARVTHDDGDHDHLARDVDAVRYLVDHGVQVPEEPPTGADLATLTAIREMVRGMVDPSNGWTDGARAVLAGTVFSLAEGGELRATAAGWTAFIGELLPPLLEVVRSRDRLRLCGNPHCRLVFLDGSRSGTRRWCDDGGCGNRDRVKRHRRRERATEAAGVPGTATAGATAKAARTAKALPD